VKHPYSDNERIITGAIFEVFTERKNQIAVSCVVTPCSDVVGHQCFGGPCCLHLHCTVKMEAAWSSKRWYPTTSLNDIPT